MIGQRNWRQLACNLCGSIRDLLPDDQVLVRVDAVLGLCRLRGMVGAFCGWVWAAPGQPLGRRCG